jgi:uncharacterized protein (TIGR02265 family)
MSDRRPPIAYARSPEHQRLIETFEGRLKGRYLLTYLAGVQFLGGTELRSQIEQDLGEPRYQLDEWYSAQDMILIFDRAVRAGLDPMRLGELVLPAYKRAHPDHFVDRTISDGFDILEKGYRLDTSYGGVTPGHEIAPGCVRLFRHDSPAPCDYFVGVLRGVLSVFGVEGTAHEVACQWQGAESCAFEVRWEE